VILITEDAFMALYAPHVYSDPMRIALLEALLGELADRARVILILQDGIQVAGTVTTRPALQHFFDHNEQPGVNATVRLDDLERFSQQHVVWLDSICEVRRMPGAAV
jgi:hypothetical protein